jgi:diaminopimelate epimerase
MDTIAFIKMHGLGNDYVYVDAVTRPEIESIDLPALARKISDRHRGVGSDGLIVLARPSESGAHVRMRMFNADGSESEMCGNGVRCVAKFAHDRLGVRAQPMLVQTGRGVLSIAYQTRDGKLSSATVDMGEPILEAKLIPTTLPAAQVINYPLPGQGERVTSGWGMACGLDPRITCVSMGNPHAVLFCSDVRKVPLEQVGPIMERAPFFPARVNVHFVQVTSRTSAIMRTWERGAGATQACGTGACAVLVAGALTDRLDRSAMLTLPGGDLLVRWDEPSDHVFMTGPAEDVFEGMWRV